MTDEKWLEPTPDKDPDEDAPTEPEAEDGVIDEPGENGEEGGEG